MRSGEREAGGETSREEESPSVAPPPEAAPPRRASRAFYMGSILLGVQVPLYAVVAYVFSNAMSVGRLRERLAEMYFLVSPAGLVYAGIVALVLLYRMWAAIREEFARTTPGWAVALFFVPVYNLFWLFRAVWGWTVDYNRMVSEREMRAPRMPESLARTASILAVASAFLFVVPVPGVSVFPSPLSVFAFPLALAAGVLFLIVLWRACDGVNALADAAAASAAGEEPPPARTSGLATASMILGLTGLCTCGLGPLVGLGLGIGALYEIDKGGGRKKGRDLAKLGIVLCAGGIVLALSTVPFVGPD